jgi:pimeloyl-ACP methyl ester carboxylesterase
VRSLSLALLASLALAAPAAAEPLTTIPAPGPGPTLTDHVSVVKFGPESAQRVLLLIPGYVSGAGDFTLVARELVKRVPGLQVWALDRRSNALEDTSVFQQGLAGQATSQQMLDYYLGWLGNPDAVQPHFVPVDGKDAPYAKQWGLSQSLDDIRRVVLEARHEGKKVILGGHSLGASTTVAYASWDFNGHAGWKDLDGLVLIDGGLMGSFSTPTLAGTKKALAEMDAQGPFVDLLGLGLPWAAGVFAELGSIAAINEPAAPSIGQSFPLLPAQFKPSFPVTNRGLLGYAFDKQTSPKGLELLRVNAGRLAAAGDPRDWADSGVEPSTVERLAQTFGQEPANGVEWYFPRKLTIDVDAVNALRRNAQTRLLKLRPFHQKEVELPLYVIQTDLTKGRVIKGAERFVRTSRSRLKRSVYVDATKTNSHLDPLTAVPSRSIFLDTVVPFLKKLR